MNNMKVKDIMTKDPACCAQDASLREAAALMVEHDCGCIPVVENEGSRKLVGVVTDRDIVCRTVAKGENPLNKKAKDAMSTPVESVAPDADLEECCRLMEHDQVRRLTVVDQQQRCVGIITQAQIAKADSRMAGELVRDVSRKTREASLVGERPGSPL